MITVGQKWMSDIKKFTRAAKHPKTPEVVWRNLFMIDLIREKVKGRCEYCDATISEDAKSVEEIYDRKAQKSKNACSVCAAIHRSLYMNYKLKNTNYFQEFDEADDRENEERKRKMK
jgi:hypothetical protein